MEEKRPLPEPSEGWKFPGWLTALVAVAIVVCVIVAFLVPAGPDVSVDEGAAVALPSGGALQQARRIEAALAAYALSHAGKYPEGRSSTEVFQKLLDAQSLNDPRIFYLPAAGKYEPQTTTLVPANVAFDVTQYPEGPASAGVPLVFCTGFRLDYKAGGGATPLLDRARPDACARGIVVVYPDHNAVYKPLGNGMPAVVPDVISAQAQLGTGRYTQLTPDGPLPDAP